MSTKTTVFLTEDNEHCYTDCVYPKYDDSGNWNGDSLFLEIDSKNLGSFEFDRHEGAVIEIKPNCELYKILISKRQ